MKHTYDVMIVDYDPEKDEANRIKHGVPLIFGVRVFADPDVAVNIGEAEQYA